MSETASPRQRWGPAVVALHWAFAALALGLLAQGGFMVHGGADAAHRFDLYQLHKSLGFSALALFVLRVLARAVTASPAPAVQGGWEGRAARAAHLGLYGVSALALSSGWLVVSTAIVPVPSRPFDLFVIPNLPGVGVAQYALAQWLHFWAVWGLAALIALHVGAALKHAFVDRDDVLRRMLPIWRARR